MSARHLLLAGVLAACGPDPEPEPVKGDQCVTCHEGIEPIHSEGALAALGDHPCTFCHGGDPDARTKERAHVPIPDDYWEIRGTGLPGGVIEGFIKDMPPDQLDRLPLDYVQFINPGDIRVVDRTCGACHAQEAATQPTSIMTTNAGHYMPTLYLSGFQGHEAIFGSYGASDPDCTGEVGTVCEVEPLRPPSAAEVQATLAAGDPDAIEEQAMHHYLAKSCDTCHAAGYGRNNSPYLYRSSGCSACHVLYGPFGVYEGDDPSIPNYPVYPREHRITKAIPTEQCTTCHFQGGRIGFLFRGMREGGFSSAPPNAEPWMETAYGHTPGYYFLDEDTTNEVDETPPDLHYAAGMHCADCHVGSDVHGTGRIYTTSKFQVDIACEDCHGTSQERVGPDRFGVFRTASGRELPQLEAGPDGEVVLVGVVDGARHPVPQVADLPAAADGIHAPDANGFSHADSLTCDTCHTSWNQYCIGCHVTVDYRFDQTDYQTGASTPGLVGGKRDEPVLGHVLLGQAPGGRIQTVVPSAQVQLGVFDPSGQVVYGQDVGDNKPLGRFRSTPTSAANIGFAPFFQHTSSRTARPCSACHRTADTPEEWDRVRGVYGFGTGQYMLPNPDGPDVDALQFLDPTGAPITDWTHIGAGPVSQAQRDRALAVEVPP